MHTEIKFTARSVGHLILHLLITPTNSDAPESEHVRLTNKEILAVAKENYPDGKTSPACVAWYASQLRRDEVYRAKHGGRQPLPPRKV